MNKILAVLAVALALTGCAEQVDSGNVGIRKSFGEVEQVSLPPGLYWYSPIGGDVLEMNVQQIRWNANTAAYTKDVQQATVGFAVNYRLRADKAYEVYSTVGTEWANALMPQIVVAAIKNEFGKWNAVDIIANRPAVQKDITAAITTALAPKYVIIERFEITNIDYDANFEKAVEEKVIAEQTALKAKNQTVTVEEQARQTVIQAKAEADSQLLRAEAEAKSIRIRADALSQNPKLVELEAVKQWDGKLPVNMYGNGAVPFIKVN